MLSVVHFGKYYYPNRGGIESVTSAAAEGAVKAGYNVSVICFSKTQSSSREIIKGVELFRCATNIFFKSQPIGIRYFLACIKKGRSANILHVHYPNMLAALSCLFVGKGPRVFLHWHSDIINKGLFGYLVRPLERLLLMRANVVVTTTDNYVEGSTAIKPFLWKVKSIPLGISGATQVPTRKVPKDGVLPRQVEEWLKGRKLVLAVGRLVPYKGFDVLIKSASNLSSDAAIVIVGDGPLKRLLQASILHNRVRKRVLLAGKLEDDELSSLFSRASVFCLPSIERSEAFGIVQVEAMAYGIPVVATNIVGSGVPWVNQHQISGINVAVGDSIALATACNEILSSESVRTKLSKGARERFLKEFSAPIFVQRILAVYSNLVDLDCA